MTQTSYEYETIRKFRKKYKWYLWSYQIFYPLIFILFLLRLHIIIPNWCDTYGYYDAEFRYHYFFGIKDCLITLVWISMCIVLFGLVPYILKRLLKEHYKEFLVAKHNGNIKYPKTNIKKRKIIICLIIILLTVLSLSNINSIIVTDTGFYMRPNVLFLNNPKEYKFEYLKDHRPHKGISNGGIAFYKDGEHGSILDFEIGKYSPNLVEFLEVLDNKTNHEYCLLEHI